MNRHEMLRLLPIEVNQQLRSSLYHMHKEQAMKVEGKSFSVCMASPLGEE